MKVSRLLFVMGTRPEAIKLAPVIRAAREDIRFDVTVCHTGQHVEMAQRVFDIFDIQPDWRLDVMRPGQTLTEVSVAVLQALAPRLIQQQFDWVIVQGDTTTAFAGALAAFYHKMPVAHVEAGLRTGDIYAPWPEEMNRRLISELTTVHFAPTGSNADTLRGEGLSPAKIHVTGNTGIDALKWVSARLSHDAVFRGQAWQALSATGVVCLQDPADTRPLVLITGHRRESFGGGFENICRAIRTLATRFPTHQFVYPVHPNPAVRGVVHAQLGGSEFSNIQLIEPLDYLPFVALMQRSCLILTDSGGIQEEGPSLGKPLVVMREVTERTEGIGTGLIRMVGVDPDKIVAACSDALEGRWVIDARQVDIYGDGLASQRILSQLEVQHD